MSNIVTGGNVSRTTFAIGDIHGMYDLYRTLMDHIDAYTSERNITDYVVVFLGDYIDRGPDSFKVVDEIRKLQLQNPERYITLRGNHEQMLLDAINGGRDDAYLFRSNGGTETLKSYGVEMEADIPFSHKQFFRETRYSYQDALRYFVHAGINPYKKLADQTNNDRLWIREMFLHWHNPFEKYVVHGHTPKMYDILEPSNRLNLDGGAVFGGSLLCAVFNDTQAEAIDGFAVKSPGRQQRV